MSGESFSFGMSMATIGVGILPLFVGVFVSARANGRSRGIHRLIDEAVKEGACCPVRSGHGERIIEEALMAAHGHLRAAAWMEWSALGWALTGTAQATASVRHGEWAEAFAVGIGYACAAVNAVVMAKVERAKAASACDFAEKCENLVSSGEAAS